RQGRAYPLRADVHFVDRAAGPAALRAVPDAAMSAPGGDPRTQLRSHEDGGAPSGRGAFFGRRKGHKLRAHQADLVAHLLPRLALEISGAAPADIADLFDPPAREIKLEIGFGGGEHLAAEARAQARTGFI